MHASTNRPLWNIPYQRNPFFTGREETLSQLHDALQAENAVALSHPQGISGLGGIGKTQTALEYAYRYRADYDAVFWVRADSFAGLTSSFVELAYVLNMPERNEQDQNLIVEAVLRWLRLHTGWLLVFDSMDDLSIAEPFLPKLGPGHILFTTRAHALGGIAQRLEVQRMEPETGALLLLRRASLLPLHTLLDGAVPNDRSIACEISQELDGLPLALDQAGAYVKETPCSLIDYLAHYRTRRQGLLQARGNFDSIYPASVATTWSLSFEKVSQANPAAAELLNFCAFLAPDAIPEEILTSGAAHLGAILAPVVTNPMHLDQVCKEVLRFSLFQRGADTRTLTVHRLVQAVLRDTLPSEIQQQWMQRAIQAVGTAFPFDELDNWLTCERLLPHALTCATWIEQDLLIMPEASHLLHETAYYLKSRARYPEAEPLLHRALRIDEQSLGPEHPNTAIRLNSLAELYRAQGKYEQAEPLYRQALSISEQQLGPEHPNTASSLHNLAGLYAEQGKYEQAEPLYQRALAIWEKQLGPEHPDTASGLNSLAELYRVQDKYEQAEPLYQRALAIREKQLGPEHPEIATSLNNLALLYQGQGKYEEAEPLVKRAFTILERQLGAEHPDTATSLNNLASLYAEQERYTEAEPLVKRALAIRERQLGAEHPDTAQSLYDLARLYHAQGKYKQAEPLYQRALVIAEKAHGPDPRNVAIGLDNLARLYYDQGKYKQAESLLQLALALREKQVGPEHPETKTIRENYVALLQAMNRDIKRRGSKRIRGPFSR